ncbi:MAG: protein kinase domain-containing protein [Anaerolineae bacterium]
MQRSMPTLPMGHTLQKRYHILRKLATGGFGAVYVAEDVRLRGRKVAVKELSDVSLASRQLFQQEARVLAALDHPGLVHVSDFFEEGRSVYLVMDYIQGRDLLELAIEAEEKKQLLPHEQVLHWLVQVCKAVAYLHRHQPPIIHRDIKPNNIRLDSSGRAILVDFGIAKVGARSKTQRMAEAVSQGFSPPEQYLSGLSTDTRSDVYALGATLYSLLTVSRPPDGLQRLTQQIPLPSVHKLNPKVAPEVEEIINTAMAIQPEQRFEDAGEMLVELQRALGLPVTALPPKPPEENVVHATPPPPPIRSRTTCPRCGYPARAGAHFCGKCGAPLQSGPRCPRCGAINRAGARFCAHCRTPLTSVHATPPPSPARRRPQSEAQRQNLQALEHAHQRQPQDANAAYALADRYMELGNHAQALPILERLVQQHPHKAELRAQLAICCIIEGQLQKATSLVNALQREHPESTEIAFLQGMIEFKRGRLKRALRHFQTVANRDPGHALAHYFIGEVYFRREQWQRALRAYQLSARANPKDADTFASICLCHLALGQKSEALKALQEALRIDPHHPLAQHIRQELKL